MLGWMRALNPFGGNAASAPSAARPTVRGSYDNAKTSPENVRNWTGADYLSAKSANSFSVRRILRNRSRYEVSNNPYLFGITHNNADDLINTGPTLQVTTSSSSYNRQVEKLWAEWCDEVGLVEKLRAAKLAKTIDGEGFLILKTVEDMAHPIKLYPVDVEADQITSPAPTSFADFWVDGLTLHPVTGQPTAYHVMRSHPGDFYFPGLNPFAVDKIAAPHVIHWFQKSRPGQVRGVPVFTPSLDLFGELRQFRRAVLRNAQVAAAFTGVIESPAPANPDDDNDTEYQAFKRTAIEMGMLTMLPANTKLTPFDPKQPQTTYEMFQEKCLGEACRPLSYPMNLALGTSQKFNFSSSKLDFVNYRGGLSIERSQCNNIVLNRIHVAWFEEGVLCGAIPAYDGLKAPPHEWHWPGFESLDPVADAQADGARLAGGQSYWQEFWAKRGRDWKDVLSQQAAEKKEIERLGLTFGEPLKQTAVQPTENPEGETVDEPAGAKR